MMRTNRFRKAQSDRTPRLARRARPKSKDLERLYALDRSRQTVAREIVAANVTLGKGGGFGERAWIIVRAASCDSWEKLL